MTQLAPMPLGVISVGSVESFSVIPLYNARAKLPFYLLLPQNLSCQACKLVGIYFLQRYDLWFKIEQELHIGG